MEGGMIYENILKYCSLYQFRIETYSCRPFLCIDGRKKEKKNQGAKLEKASVSHAPLKFQGRGAVPRPPFDFCLYCKTSQL